MDATVDKSRAIDVAAASIQIVNASLKFLRVRNGGNEIKNAATIFFAYQIDTLGEALLSVIYHTANRTTLIIFARRFGVDLKTFGSTLHQDDKHVASLGEKQMGQVQRVEFRTARQLTLADLPARGTMYWCDRQKADVVAAVRSGLLTFEQASEWYMLSAEEFITWLKLDYVGRSATRSFASPRKVVHRHEKVDSAHPLHVTAH